MHGVVGKPPDAAANGNAVATSKIMLLMLVAMTGVAPISLYMLVPASIGCSLAQTLPQLIAARFLQALGGAAGMVVSRAIIRDLYSRDRISSMISLVIAVMMIAQMLSPLTGGLLETAFGWRAIFYLITAASLTITIMIALMLPETRRDRLEAGG